MQGNLHFHGTVCRVLWNTEGEQCARSSALAGLSVQGGLGRCRVLTLVQRTTDLQGKVCRVVWRVVCTCSMHSMWITIGLILWMVVTTRLMCRVDSTALAGYSAGWYGG